MVKKLIENVIFGAHFLLPETRSKFIISPVWTAPGNVTFPGPIIDSFAPLGNVSFLSDFVRPEKMRFRA